MDNTIVVAGMGLLATAGTAWLSAGSQRRSARDDRLLEAKLRVYGECSFTLHELARVTFNRVAARIDDRPDTDRDVLRQEFYRANALARSAIGQVAIIARETRVRLQLEAAREAIGGLNSAHSRSELTVLYKDAQSSVASALESASNELRRNDRSARWWRALPYSA